MARSFRHLVWHKPGERDHEAAINDVVFHTQVYYKNMTTPETVPATDRQPAGHQLATHQLTTHRVFEHNGEMVVENLDPQEVEDLPSGLEPGTKILREDGNVYTLGDDGMMLIDGEDFIVNPFGLQRFLHQERFRTVMKVSGEIRRRGIDLSE